MKGQDISKDPDMIELERMIAAGELDPDRVTRYADEEEQKSQSNTGSGEDEGPGN